MSKTYPERFCALFEALNRRMGLPYVAEKRALMGTIEIKLDLLEEAILSQTRALDTLKSAAGQRVDRVQELCELVGISKKTLAKAIILENQGDISQTDIARKLNIHERTLRKTSWHDVRTLLTYKD